MILPVLGALHHLSNLNKKFEEYIVIPGLNKIPEQLNKDLLYSAFYVLTPQLIYNIANDFLPIIGMPVAFLLAFIAGAVIQRNYHEVTYKDDHKRSVMEILRTFAYGACASMGALILAQADNALPQVIGLTAATYMHYSFAKGMDEDIQNGVNKLNRSGS